MVRRLVEAHLGTAAVACPERSRRSVPRMERASSSDYFGVVAGFGVVAAAGFFAGAVADFAAPPGF